MKKSKKLITHSGSFHADDVFACAALVLLLEKNQEKFEIIRTRDEKIIKTGDYVFDVGGIYNAGKNRFDHHQNGGAGRRKNGIEYASFGLVWKKFGKELVGSDEAAETIDKKMVQSIDAVDSGINIAKSILPDVVLYDVAVLVSAFLPTAFESHDENKGFLKIVDWAKIILRREIKRVNDEVKIKKIIRDFYQRSVKKKIIVIDKPKVSREQIWDALQNFTEPLFVIYGEENNWRVVAMRKNRNSFGNRKDLPQEWGGLNGEELQKTTGVTDAVFCSRNLFLAGVKSKEGAIKLAQLALNN